MGSAICDIAIGVRVICVSDASNHRLASADS